MAVNVQAPSSQLRPFLSTNTTLSYLPFYIYELLTAARRVRAAGYPAPQVCTCVRSAGYNCGIKYPYLCSKFALVSRSVWYMSGISHSLGWRVELLSFSI